MASLFSERIFPPAYNSTHNRLQVYISLRRYTAAT